MTAQSSVTMRRWGPAAIVTLAAMAALTALTTEAVARQPHPAPIKEVTAPRPAGEPIMAIVSIKTQEVTFYDADGWITRAPVSSGVKGRETPAGVFAVIEKDKDHHSSMYDDAWMPNMQRITWNGVALHGGPLPGYAASHGCVRMPYGFAEKLFDKTRIGMRVIISPNDAALHEYKRQSLNLLEAIALYQDIRANPGGDFVPRVKIFAGKAAASYERAKLLIKLAHDIAAVVNNDPVIAGRLKVVFAPNYSASLAASIVPASDLSEQISTAGMEASGTGNMKLALNGAITIGTLDGANIEISENVGIDNVFIFGRKADEIARLTLEHRHGAQFAGTSPRLKAALDSLAAGEFSPSDKGRYTPLVDALLGYDRYMVAADFDAYWDAQREVDALWRSPADWWHKSILNTARMGWFSSDRAIREYAHDIWRVPTI